jgi:plastocyanin
MKLTAAALALTLAVGLALPGTAAAQEGMLDPNAVPMVGNMFVPAEKTVAVGTTVTWMNFDPEDHNVLTNDLMTISSPNIPPGESFSYTFMTEGTFDYVCDLHRDMAGKVIVTAAG